MQLSNKFWIKMKYFFMLFFLVVSCTKPEIVHICGDHVCVNKDEARQYFEDNLSLEVKVINNKKKEEIDLIKLNLISSPDEKKKINMFKIKRDKKIKVLSKNEIKEKKIEIKKRIDDERKIVKKETKFVKKIKKKDKNKKKITNVLRKDEKISSIDICEILEKCDIDEISRYLIKLGKNKDFPDITLKE